MFWKSFLISYVLIGAKSDTNMLKLLLLEITILIISISMSTVSCDSPMLWLHVVQPNLAAGNEFINVFVD
jgi:hypothetical protein